MNKTHDNVSFSMVVIMRSIFIYISGFSKGRILEV